MRPPGSPEELQRRRERAWALLHQGYPPVEVAERVGVDRRSVRRWKAEYAWSYLKKNPLAHHPATALSGLAETARHSGQSLQRKPRLLRSFLDDSSLFLRLK